MIIVYQYLLPIFVIVFVLVSILIVKGRWEYSRFIRRYFFLKRSKKSHVAFFFLLISIFLFLMIPLKFKRVSHDILFLKHYKISIFIDISSSMLTPTYDGRKDRLRQGLEFVEALISYLPNQYQFSINLFSKNGINLTPFTSDKVYLKNVLKTLFLNKDQLDSLGTDLRNVLFELKSSLDLEGRQVSDRFIFVTDGGDSSPNESSLEFLKGLRGVSFVGVGDTIPRPLIINGKERKQNNQIISTSRNDLEIGKMCAKIADCDYKVAQGLDPQLFSQQLISNFNDDSSPLERDFSKELMLLALIFFSLSTMIFLTGRSFVFDKRVPHTIFLFCLLFLNPPDVSANSFFVEEINLLSKKYNLKDKIALANNFYYAGKFKDALTVYKELSQNCANCSYLKEIRLNLGTIMMITGEIKEGISFLDNSLLLIPEEEKKDYVEKMKNNILFILRKREKLKLYNQNEREAKEIIAVDIKSNLYVRPMSEEEIVQQEIIDKILKIRIKKQKISGYNW